MKEELMISGMIILGVVACQYFLSNRGADKERFLRRHLNDEDSWYNKNLREKELSEEDSVRIPDIHGAPSPTIQAYPTRTPTCGHSLDCFLYYWESQRDFAKYGMYFWGYEDSPLFTPKMPGKTVEYPSNEVAEEIGRKDFIEGRGFLFLPEPVCFNPKCIACLQTKYHRGMFLKYYSHGYNSARKAVEM